MAFLGRLWKGKESPKADDSPQLRAPTPKFGRKDARSAIVHHGVLEQQTKKPFSKQKWKPRYYVVHKGGPLVKYFSEEAFKADVSRKAGAVVDTANLSLSSEVPENLGFGLFHPSRKPLIFRATDERALAEWINAVEQQCLGLSSASVTDFTITRLLGQGSFGKVWLVRHNRTFVKYAMKTIAKSTLRDEAMKNQVKTEQRVLELVNHPFIVRLNFAFHSETDLCFVMEYVSGGELYEALQVSRRFHVTRMRVYVAEVALALQYLHKLGIVFGDLKPENVLVDEEGHLKLTDFGLAKELDSLRKAKASHCGSPFYIAPEVLRGNQFDEAVDYWALGILAYEMLVGLPPWFCQDWVTGAKRMLVQPLVFPSGLDPSAVALISELLDKDPAARLGAPPHGAATFCAHEFFEALDWQAVLEKKVDPRGAEPAPLLPPTPSAVHATWGAAVGLPEPPERAADKPQAANDEDEVGAAPTRPISHSISTATPFTHALARANSCELLVDDASHGSETSARVEVSRLASVRTKGDISPPRMSFVCHDAPACLIQGGESRHDIDNAIAEALAHATKEFSASQAAQVLAVEAKSFALGHGGSESGKALHEAVAATVAGIIPVEEWDDSNNGDSASESSSPELLLAASSSPEPSVVWEDTGLGQRARDAEARLVTIKQRVDTEQALLVSLTTRRKEEEARVMAASARLHRQTEALRDTESQLDTLRRRLEEEEAALQDVLWRRKEEEARLGR